MDFLKRLLAPKDEDKPSIGEVGAAGKKRLTIVSEEVHAKVQRLQEQREYHNSVDLVALIEAFPETIRRHLLKGAQHVQFTDGCTGGCAWCSFDVKRKISEGFSFESWEKFSSKYIMQLPDRVALYWATDPLDIGGKKFDGSTYDYVDVFAAAIDNLRPRQRIYTSTVMPDGTYDVAKHLIRFLHDHWVSHHFYDDEDNKIHNVRFSVTKDNENKVAALEKDLKGEIHPNFLKACFAEAEDRQGDNIKKVGKFARHPERSPLTNGDVTTVACYDGTLITPDGIEAIAMEAVTKDNPYGQMRRKINATDEEVEIPVYLIMDDFTDYGVIRDINEEKIPKLLPNITFEVIDPKTGQVKKRKEEPTLRRDLLAYVYAATAVHKLSGIQLNQKQKSALVEYGKALDRRWEQTQKLIPNSSDEEANTSIETWYSETKKRLDLLLISQA